MNQDHAFTFGHLKMADSYAVISCNEGAHIDFDEIREIQAVLYPAYRGGRYGLIADRKNHYSVNPLAINALFSEELLVAGAIVGHSRATEVNAEIESRIVRTSPIQYFDDMDCAIHWVLETVVQDC